MLLTKSPTFFVLYYNITYKVYILLLYHLLCYSSAFFSLPCPRSTDHLVLRTVHDTTMINVHDMAINIFIFISQGILLSSTGIIDLHDACSHALNCGHNSPSVWYVVLMPRYVRRHRVRCNFMETQARATTVPDVPRRTQYRCVYLLMHCIRKFTYALHTQINLCEHSFSHSCIRLITPTTTHRFIAFYSFHSPLHSLLSLQTMSAGAEPARSGRKPVGGFPSDPRYASSTLTATPSEMSSCLGTRTEYLSTAVLDCIIQCTAALPPKSSEEAFPPIMIGSLGCVGYISSSNYTASLKRDQVRTTAEWKAYQRQVSLIRRRLAGIINPKPPIDLPQRLIMPTVNPPDMIGHFFVPCFEFDTRNPKFFVAITFYNTLERAKRRIHQSSTAVSRIVKRSTIFQCICSAQEKGCIHTTVRYRRCATGAIQGLP